MIFDSNKKVDFLLELVFDKKRKKWINRGSNPGPTACKAGVIPLHHVPPLTNFP